MRAPVHRLATAFLVAAAAFGWMGAAPAASLFELNFWLPGPRYDAVVPLCEDPFPLSTIQRRFSTKERRFWNSQLQILGFSDVREIAFMPWASGTIPRRFCAGKVLVSDGLMRPIHYSIGEDTGIIGATFGVEWCVVGLDRNWAYNPNCKMARP
jgi:hypothetical protein